MEVVGKIWKGNKICLRKVYYMKVTEYLYVQLQRSTITTNLVPYNNATHVLPGGQKSDAGVPGLKARWYQRCAPSGGSRVGSVESCSSPVPGGCLRVLGNVTLPRLFCLVLPSLRPRLIKALVVIGPTWERRVIAPPQSQLINRLHPINSLAPSLPGNGARAQVWMMRVWLHLRGGGMLPIPSVKSVFSTTGKAVF